MLPDATSRSVVSRTARRRRSGCLQPNAWQADCRPFLQSVAAAFAQRSAAAGFPVAANIGCVTFDVAPGSLVDALRAADQAMYAAKAAGKCCLLFH
jgi:GGDEF domain-containing protein